MSPDIHQIRVVSEVARSGSMTAAARSMGYTLSAISQQVRRLESEIGLAVLERHARGARLTDAGRAVVEAGGAVESQLAALDDRLADIAGLRAGTLRLATFPTAGAGLLPVAITRFAARHPGVTLSLRSARIGALLDLLRARAVESALLWDYEWTRFDESDLHLELLMRDPTDLLVAVGHPLAGAPSLRMADLAGERWITRAEGHPVADVLRRSAVAAGFEPTVAFEAHDYQEVQGMVAVGLGVALAPRLATANLRADVRAIPLGDDAAHRRILLARDARRVPAPPELAMLEVLRGVSTEVAGQLRPGSRESRAGSR
ncbi:LysR family transcriptional regulator [Georgenia sp. Z1491]|uniref:LysR family transcriptional regulator n=1 Tax=Georgenia sp. Z1491 TaxID=3416707 RepID=UPI003CE7FE2E